MTDNIYAEHATNTQLLGQERIKNKRLMILLKVCGFIFLMQIVWVGLRFGLALRADRFFYSECVNYPKLPIVVPTPMQK